MFTVKKIDRSLAAALLPPRKENSCKSDFGAVLTVAGSPVYRGAAYFSSVAALRSGAGYVTLAGPEPVLPAVVTSGVVTVRLKSRRGTISSRAWRQVDSLLDRYDVLSFGCGLSRISGIPARLERFFDRILISLQRRSIPVILDADGLQLLSRACCAVPARELPGKLVLTPHPGEMARLANLSVEEVQKDRVAVAGATALRFGAVVVLKGRETIVTDGQKTLVNTTGSSALAKAGTGDVLTGIIGGFCAQGLSPFDAATLGVYVHGLAGEQAATKKTDYGVLADDVLGYIPDAIHALL